MSSRSKKQNSSGNVAGKKRGKSDADDGISQMMKEKLW